MPITSEELRDILREHAAAGPADPVRRAQIHRRIRRTRRRRAIGAGAAGLAVLLAVALATGVLPGPRDRTAAASGNTTVTLVPSVLPGTPSRAQLDAARDTLLHRFAAMQLPTRSITVNQDGTLTVRIAAKVPLDELRMLVSPGGLTSRAVLAAAADHPPSEPVTSDPPTTPAPTLDQVRALVGDAAYAAAADLHQVPTDGATLAALAPFRGLTPGEVAVLPDTIQFYVPMISCAQLDARDPYYAWGGGRLNQTIVACGPVDYGRGEQKLLLTGSLMQPSAVVAADYRYDLQQRGGWYVEAYVTPDAAHIWSVFTNAHVGDRIAYLVDTTAVMVPQLRSGLTAPVWFGQLTKVTAARYAAMLDTGLLKIDLMVTDLRQ